MERTTDEQGRQESNLDRRIQSPRSCHWTTPPRERNAGVEPAWPEWKSGASPIGQSRLSTVKRNTGVEPVWTGVGFRCLCRSANSARTHSSRPVLQKCKTGEEEWLAPGGNRTRKACLKGRCDDRFTTEATCIDGALIDSRRHASVFTLSRNDPVSPGLLGLKALSTLAHPSGPPGAPPATTAQRAADCVQAACGTRTRMFLTGGQVPRLSAKAAFLLEPQVGIEPTSPVYETGALPLSYRGVTSRRGVEPRPSGFGDQIARRSAAYSATGTAGSENGRGRDLFGPGLSRDVETCPSRAGRGRIEAQTEGLQAEAVTCAHPSREGCHGRLRPPGIGFQALHGFLGLLQ